MSSDVTTLQKIVVIGASGVVGKSVLSALQAMDFPADHVVPVHSGSRPGARVSYGEERDLALLTMDKVDLTSVGTLILCVPETAMSGLNSYLSKFSGRLIDASGYFALDPKTSLVVPHVTPKDNLKLMCALAHPIVSGVVHALHGFSQNNPVKSLAISTYEGVSVEGMLGMAELMQQTKDTLMNKPSPINHFPKTMAFNVIPCVGRLPRVGIDTPEEEKIRLQLCKYYKRQIPVSVSRVLVPAFVGVGISLHATFEKPLAKEDLAASESEGVRAISQPDSPHEDYATHLDVSGDDFIFIGRRRINAADPKQIQQWVILDNARWGGAVGVDYLLNDSELTDSEDG